MKNYRALFFLFPILFLTFTGCDFRPVYGTHGADEGSPVALDLNNVAIANIPDRKGQMLRNDLIDRMYGKNRPQQPEYTLNVSIVSSEEQLGILANATATRTLLSITGNYSLTSKDGKIILTGEAHSVSGYNRLDQMYGTVAAEQDAYDRTLHEVSEQIVNRLSVYFSERK
jgi:LPS-assembly lipoprotein